MYLTTFSGGKGSGGGAAPAPGKGAKGPGKGASPVPGRGARLGGGIRARERGKPGSSFLGDAARSALKGAVLLGGGNAVLGTSGSALGRGLRGGAAGALAGIGDAALRRFMNRKKAR